MKKLKQKTTNHLRTRELSPSLGDRHQTFAEHLLELRRRLLFVAATILVFAAAAYFVQQRLVAFLLRPAHNQHFIYTSPGGGIAFLFQVCTYVGITAGIPVFVYQLLRFIEPVIGDDERRFIAKMGWLSAFLAIMGFSFGYLIGLPAALHFLGHQFTTTQIQPLLTIQEYMSFITVYLVGSALIFQLPLIVLFINRVKPLKPSQLFKSERYIIAGAFIVSMLMAPTVNVVDQLVLAGPIILTYQVAVIAVLFKNRSKRPAAVTAMLEQDRQAQLIREQAVAGAMPIEAGQLPTSLPPKRPAVNAAAATVPAKPTPVFDVIERPTRWQVPANRTLISVQFK
jgi:sec-independent protein translocase protein TatC